MINSPDWNQKISTMLSKIHFEEIGLGVYKASFPPIGELVIVRRLSKRNDGRFTYQPRVVFLKGVVEGVPSSDFKRAVSRLKKLIRIIFNIDSSKETKRGKEDGV